MPELAGGEVSWSNVTFDVLSGVSLSSEEREHDFIILPVFIKLRKLLHFNEVYMRLTYETRMSIYSFTMRSKPIHGINTYSIPLVNTALCILYWKLN
jgi:hypothetical protein